MKLTVHPSHDFRVYTADKLMPFTRKVVSQITLNAGTFPGAAILVGSATTEINTLETKNLAYLGNPLLFTAMENQRKVVVKILNKLNKIVDTAADGDAAIIDLGGFDKTSSESVPGKKPGNCIIHDSYPEAKGKYYVQVEPLGRNVTYIFILCALDAVVTFEGSQVLVSKGPNTTITDTHPHAEFSNVASGDQKLIVVALNASGFGKPTTPSTVSIP